jgi:hypothetical protein
MRPLNGRGCLTRPHARILASPACSGSSGSRSRCRPAAWRSGPRWRWAAARPSTSPCRASRCRWQLAWRSSRPWAWRSSPGGPGRSVRWPCRSASPPAPWPASVSPRSAPCRSPLRWPCRTSGPSASRAGWWTSAAAASAARASFSPRSASATGPPRPRRSACGSPCAMERRSPRPARRCGCWRWSTPRRRPPAPAPTTSPATPGSRASAASASPWARPRRWSPPNPRPGVCAGPWRSTPPAGPWPRRSWTTSALAPAGSPQP